MEEATKKIMERIEKKNPADMSKFIEIQRKIFNDFCPDCKTTVMHGIRTRKSFTFDALCDLCQHMAKNYEEELNAAL